MNFTRVSFRDRSSSLANNDALLLGVRNFNLLRYGESHLRDDEIVHANVRAFEMSHNEIVFICYKMKRGLEERRIKIYT